MRRSPRPRTISELRKAAQEEHSRYRAAVKQRGIARRGLRELERVPDELRPAVVASGATEAALQKFTRFDEIAKRARQLRDEAMSEAGLLTKQGRQVQAVSRRTLLEERISKGESRIRDLERHGEAAVAMARKQKLHWLKSNPPGRWRAILEEFDRVKADLHSQLDFASEAEKPALRATLAELEDDVRGNWMELSARGVDPVYLHRIAKGTALEEVPIIAGTKPNLPGSVRTPGKLNTAYERNPVIMLLRDEVETAQSFVMARTVANVYEKAGGKTWSQAIDDYKRMGFEPDKAEGLVRARFDSINPSGSITPAKAGNLLIPKNFSRAIKGYLDPAIRRGSIADKALGAWMVPTLWMSPVFHANNIVGGAILTGQRLTFTPKALFKLSDDIAEAFRAAKAGRHINPKVPTGGAFGPAISTTLDARSIAIAERLYGRNLGVLSRYLIRPSEKLNQFFDGFYRNLMYLNKKSAGYSDDAAALSAGRVMQDWDSLIPLEREIFQRVVPFWGWKRTLIRHAMTYPLDHPFRTQVMRFAAKDYEERRDVSPFVHELLKRMMPVGDKDANGYQTFMSTRGVDPFSDYTTMNSVAGWLQSVHPVAQILLAGAQYDPFLQGVREWDPSAKRDIDPRTGQEVRPFSAMESLFGLVPQGRAVQMWLEGRGDKPDEETLDGWWDWIDRYGASARLTPSISRLNLEKEEQKVTKSTAFTEAKRRGDISTIPIPITEAGKELLAKYAKDKEEKKPTAEVSGGNWLAR